MLNLANPGTEVDEPGNDDGIRNVAKEPTNNWYNKEGQFGISVLVADSLHVVMDTGTAPVPNPVWPTAMMAAS